MIPKILDWVCHECGVSAHVLTIIKKHKDVPDKLSFTTSTYHEGKCDFCGRKKFVTQPRDFFYPDFSLLAKATGREMEV